MCASSFAFSDKEFALFALSLAAIASFFDFIDCTKAIKEKIIVAKTPIVCIRQKMC